jgi:hypothetical protein
VTRLLPLPLGEHVRLCDAHEWASIPADPGCLPEDCPACADVRGRRRYEAYAPEAVNRERVIEAQRTAIAELQETVLALSRDCAATEGELRELRSRLAGVLS